MTSIPSRDNSSVWDAELAQIAERISDRILAGELIGETEIRRDYPQDADALIDILPAMIGLAARSSSQPYIEVSPLVIPATLPGYRIIRELGRGGMGVVFLATQLRLNRLVALKMILPGKLPDDSAIRRFQAEAEAAAKLDHPSIVPVYDVGEHCGQPFFSMGYIDGESLAHRLAAGPVPPEDAIGLLKRIAEAVEHAHRRGVIHRDLKPGNVLLDNQGHPRVADFGLAKRIQDGSYLTCTGQVLGTPSYMPPEQARADEAQSSPQGDIYALGALMYHLLTGKPPFLSASPMGTLMQVIHDNPVAPRRLDPRIPRDLETICLKCLEKEPGRRYSTAQELVDELGRAERGEAILARPVSAAGRIVRWSRRHQTVASLICGTVVLMLVGSLALVNIQQREQAKSLVERIKTTEFATFPATMNDLLQRRHSETMLRQATRQTPANSPGDLQFRIGLALLPFDNLWAARVRADLPARDIRELLALSDYLRRYKEVLSRDAWSALANDQLTTEVRFRATCVIAALDDAGRDSMRWNDAVPLIVEEMLRQMSQNPSDFPALTTLFRSSATSLIPCLREICCNEQRSDVQRLLAAQIIADYAHGDPATLIECLVNADAPQFSILFPRITRFTNVVMPLLDRELNQTLTMNPADLANEKLSRRQANAAVTAYRLGHPDRLWPLLKASPDPRVRSAIIHRMSPFGASLNDLVKHLTEQTNPSIRQALLLMLGEAGPHGLSEAKRLAVLDNVETIFVRDPDPSVHSAAEWFLRTWRESRRINIDLLREVSAASRKVAAPQELGWFVNSQGMTMIVMPAPDQFWMGSPADEPGRDQAIGGHDPERRRRRRIDRAFAMSAHEVTIAQFLRDKRFAQHHFNPQLASPNYKEDRECPVQRVTWYEAAAYCNFLSQMDGIPQDQWCYDPDQSFGNGMQIREKYLSLSGYRLPSEAEWEYACRARTVTSFSFGQSPELLDKFAWSATNSQQLWTLPVGSLKPNLFGFFDMHGNVGERCQEGMRDEVAEGPDLEDTKPVEDGRDRVQRGGSFMEFWPGMRSAAVYSSAPDPRINRTGFRVARSIVER